MQNQSFQYQKFIHDVVDWVSTVLNKEFSGDVFSLFADGTILCEVISRTCPFVCPFITESVIYNSKTDGLELLRSAFVCLGIQQKYFLDESLFVNRDIAGLIKGLEALIVALLRISPANALHLPEDGTSRASTSCVDSGNRVICIKKLLLEEYLIEPTSSLTSSVQTLTESISSQQVSPFEPNWVDMRDLSCGSQSVEIRNDSSQKSPKEYESISSSDISCYSSTFDTNAVSNSDNQEFNYEETKNRQNKQGEFLQKLEKEKIIRDEEEERSELARKVTLEQREKDNEEKEKMRERHVDYGIKSKECQQEKQEPIAREIIHVRDLNKEKVKKKKLSFGLAAIGSILAVAAGVAAAISYSKNKDDHSDSD